jgi:hypothetical protein
MIKNLGINIPNIIKDDNLVNQKMSFELTLFELILKRGKTAVEAYESTIYFVNSKPFQDATRHLKSLKSDYHEKGTPHKWAQFKINVANERTELNAILNSMEELAPNECDTDGLPIIFNTDMSYSPFVKNTVSPLKMIDNLVTDIPTLSFNEEQFI